MARQQNLADKLYDSLLLYHQIRDFPKDIQKDIMLKPELLTEYVNKFYADNVAI
jgi:hypothetical protein